jgi:DNA-binding transcriptional MerR regulator
MSPSNDSLGIREAARLLGIHPNTLRNWGAVGRIAESRTGPRRDRKYSRAELERVKAELQRKKDTPTQAGVGPVEVRYALGAGGMAESILRFRNAFDSEGMAQMLRQYAQIQQSLGTVTNLMHSYRGALQHVSQFALVSKQIEDMIRPSSSLLNALGETIRMSQQTGVIAAFVADQQLIAARMADMVRLFPPSYASGFITATGPAERAFAVLDDIVAISGDRSLASLRAASITSSFRTFTDDVADRLPAEPSEAQSGLAVGQFDIGSDVLDVAVPALRPLSKMSAVADSGSTESIVNIFQMIILATEVRRPGLLSLGPGEIAHELRQIPAVRISQAADRLMRARSRCTRATELLGLEPMFSASVDTEDAAASLPLHIANDEEGFRTFIDRLYKLVYESSGALKRIAAEFTQPDSEFFVLKDIRTYYFHDLHHGEASKQRRKLRDVAEAFTRLIGAPFLRGEADYLNAQLALLSCLADLLDRIETNLLRLTNSS